MVKRNFSLRFLLLVTVLAAGLAAIARHQIVGSYVLHPPDPDWVALREFRTGIGPYIYFTLESPETAAIFRRSLDPAEITGRAKGILEESNVESVASLELISFANLGTHKNRVCFDYAIGYWRLKRFDLSKMQYDSVSDQVTTQRYREVHKAMSLAAVAYAKESSLNVKVESFSQLMDLMEKHEAEMNNVLKNRSSNQNSK